MPPTYRVGVDIGGTFTDIVVLGSDGSIHIRKVSSSVDDYARALVDGLTEALREAGLTGGEVEEIRHGTTVASNAILEHKGAKVGLITTKGFRDVLEIRTLRAPRLYDLAWQKPPPLIERYLRRVVDERIDHAGAVERALDPKDAERAVDALLAEGVEAIAVCLINSFVNPAHELAIKQIIARKAPRLPLSVSCEVLPEIKEYERTSTTAIDAYVKPIVATYLHALRAGLDAAGVPARLLLMQSNGGLTTDAAAAERPMNIIESGPAGGVIGAQVLAQGKRLESIITFDMGGTTAKASLIRDGQYETTPDYEVGGGSSRTRWMNGTGHPIRVPVIDLAEVSAGGGSIAWVDRAGALKVGPKSAGADPGPVCYGRGGSEPTVTDCNLLLGYLDARSLLAGDLPIDRDAAEAAVRDKLAKPLGIDARTAAAAVIDVVNHAMAEVLRIVSVQRGHDPREFVLAPFGGAGPLHCAALAGELGVAEIICPPIPGAFSALGLIGSDLKRDYARTVYVTTAGADPAALEAAFAALEKEGDAMLARARVPAARRRFERAVDARYERQSYELLVPVPPGALDAVRLVQIAEAFHDLHRRTYGHDNRSEPVQLVNIRLTAIGLIPSLAVRDNPAAPGSDALKMQRPLWFRATGEIEAAVLDRARMPAGLVAKGPAVIESLESTLLVPPGWQARMDEDGFVVLTPGR